LWAGLVLLLDLAGVTLILLIWDLSMIEDWLPKIVAIVLAGVAAAPSLALMMGRIGALSTSLAHGLSFSRAKDVVSLARVRRWQMDPRLLAAPGEVEAVALADTPADALLQIAGALLEAEKGPELASVRAALEKKKLPLAQGAALSKNNGVLRGTVDGKRYFLGPQQAMEEEEKIAIDDNMAGTIDFLRDKNLLTHLIGNPEEGVLGAVGIGLSAEADAKAAAHILGATVMPGLPDSTRQVIAKAAEIECDGPPLHKRDATVLAIDSEPPSDGLRLRVMPLTLGQELPEGSSPRMFRPALANAARAAKAVKRIHLSAQLVAIALGILPASIAVALAYADVAGGLVGTLLGLIAVIAAGRAQKWAAPKSFEAAP
jgi:hypothetical protein